MARRLPPLILRAVAGLTPALPGLIVAIGLATPGAASAEIGTDWRFCMALWEPNRSVYVTMPFPSQAPLNEVEAAYAAFLDTRGLPHEAALCPRADTEAKALAMRDDAIAYNRIRGLSASLAFWRLGR